VTAYGLWLLWRRRGGLAEGRGRTMFGAALLGFALWNVVDVVGFHWILGIHRIRVGVPDPLTYDLGWLAAFGLLPLACALPLLKPRQGNGAGGMGAAAALALLAVGSAALAARPQPNGGSALVVLAPGSSAGDALDLARAADARILWVDPAGRLMAVAIDEEARGRLYSAGAWLVTRSPALAGCAASLESRRDPRSGRQLGHDHPPVYAWRLRSIAFQLGMVIASRYSCCISGVSTSIIWQPSMKISITPKAPPRLQYLASQPSRLQMVKTRSLLSFVAIAMWTGIVPPVGGQHADRIAAGRVQLGAARIDFDHGGAFVAGQSGPAAVDDGRERQRPDHGEESYKGSGRLERARRR
jgi:hypothetical protein